MTDATEKPIVVLAEDHKMVRDLVKEIFEKSGYEVHAHEYAQEALDAINALLARGIKPGLVTDLEMAGKDRNNPKMDGVALLKCLADQGIQMPTIIMSLSIDKLKARLAQEGITPDPVFEKPPAIAQLKSAMAEAFAKHYPSTQSPSNGGGDDYAPANKPSFRR